MLTYPAIDPVAFSLGPLKVHWYGLTYLAGFLMAFGLALWRVKHYQLKWTREEVSDLIFYAAIGVIVGGRLGYMLFYNTHQLVISPWNIVKVWEGGMSFHGGILGVAVAVGIYAARFHRPFWQVADFVAPLVPLGLACGRIGNFINGELWGRVSDVPWAMIFPMADDQPRHPSQLYEFFLEGLLLFLVVWIYARKPRPFGCVSAVFLMGYGLCRLIAECFREPDIQLGFLVFDWVTMGQILSIPMVLIGLWLWWSKRCKPI